MTTSTSSPPEVSTESSLSTVTAVGSVFAALGSAGYVAMNGMEPREAFAHPLSVVACSVATLGALMLAFALARWRVNLPGWAVLGAAVGMALVAANSWFFASGIVGIANHTDDALFETISRSDWVIVMTAPKMLLCLVCFLAIAISGWRSRVIPRSAAVALGVAAVLSLIPPHPPGLILASLAFFLIARSGMAARE